MILFFWLSQVREVQNSWVFWKNFEYLTHTLNALILVTYYVPGITLLLWMQQIRYNPSLTSSKVPQSYGREKHKDKSLQYSLAVQLTVWCMISLQFANSYWSAMGLVQIVRGSIQKRLEWFCIRTKFKLFFVFCIYTSIGLVCNQQGIKKANKHTRNSPLSQIDWEVLFCVMSVFTSAWRRKMEKKFKLAGCLLTIYHIFLWCLLPLRSKGNKGNVIFGISYWAYFILK